VSWRFYGVGREKIRADPSSASRFAPLRTLKERFPHAQSRFHGIEVHNVPYPLTWARIKHANTVLISLRRQHRECWAIVGSVVLADSIVGEYQH